MKASSTEELLAVDIKHNRGNLKWAEVKKGADENIR